jgi:hypothetical protein
MSHRLRPVEFCERVEVPDSESATYFQRIRDDLEDRYWELRQHHPLTPKADFDLGPLPGVRVLGWVAQTIV